MDEREACYWYGDTSNNCEGASFFQRQFASPRSRAAFDDSYGTCRSIIVGVSKRCFCRRNASPAANANSPRLIRNALSPPRHHNDIPSRSHRSVAVARRLCRLAATGARAGAPGFQAARRLCRSRAAPRPSASTSLRVFPFVGFIEAAGEVGLRAGFCRAAERHGRLARLCPGGC